MNMNRHMHVVSFTGPYLYKPSQNLTGICKIAENFRLYQMQSTLP